MNKSTAVSTQTIGHKRPHLTVINGTVKTTSLDVAEKFGKKHFHVLRAIEDFGIPNDFRESNFGLSEYIVEGQVKPYKMYEMTRDGFTILAMGFTGKKAMEWKIKYLTAFNLMEQHIIEQKRKALTASGILTPFQQRKVQQLVKAKASRLNPDGKPDKGTYMKIYATIKDRFQVAKYSQVPQKRFDELTTFLGEAWNEVYLKDEKIEPAETMKTMIENAVQKAMAKTVNQKSLEDQIEAESHGWYDKHWALRRVMHSKKLDEIARLDGLLDTAGVRESDKKKPEEFYICEEVFAMLEHLIFNAPKVMDSLLTMRINSLKGQLVGASRMKSY